MTRQFDPAVLPLLACPCPRHGALEWAESAEQLRCTVCGRSFPIRDGVPVLLLDHAVGGPTQSS